MKIRSSRELKESMQNVDKVIENELVDTVVTIDPILADTYEQNKEIETQVEETLDELTKKAEDIIEEAPEAPMTVDNIYTTQIKLDESIEDFRLQEDGRKNKVATMGEDEGDRYLDYSMYDFVSELLTGKDCNTNPAPITPIVWRRDPKTKEFRYMEMKKFNPIGEDSVSYDGANIYGGEYDETDISANATDVPGMYLGTGSTQLGAEDDGFTVYSSSREDLEQAQQGLAHYGIRYGEITERLSKSKSIHWDYRMRVYVPMNSRGEFLTLTEWLDKTHRKVEEVMRPNFVQSYNKRKSKVDNQENDELVKSIYDAYVIKSNQNSDIPVDVLLNDMFDEMEGLRFDREAIERKFRQEVETPTYYDIFDKYVSQIEEDPSLNPKKVFNEMLKELKTYHIKVDRAEAFEEFMDELK